MQVSHVLKAFSGTQWGSSRNIRNFPSNIIFQMMWNGHISSYNLVYPTDNNCMDSNLRDLGGQNPHWSTIYHIQ